MALGDYRYHERVSAETKAAVETMGWDPCEWYVPGMEAASYYPAEVREFMRFAEDRLRQDGRHDEADEMIVMAPDLPERLE